MTDPLLEARARAVEEGRQQVAAAGARVEELAGPYNAATAELRKLRAGLKVAERGLEQAKRDHATRRALEEAGVAFAAPLSVVTEVYEGVEVFYLVAVGSEGSGLYLHRYDRARRHFSQTHAIALERVPEGEKVYASSAMREAGIAEWQQRGTGAYGAGSGAHKPKPPPEGGRWRWLKVREQEALPA